MLNKSKDEGQTLPRIQSQKRVHTALDRKENSREGQDKKTQPNNRQLKRAFSTTNTCKAVRYETTGLMYSKKIADLITQNETLDKQIKRIEEEIIAAKKNSQLQPSRPELGKQGRSNFITEVTDEANSKVSVVNKNLNNEKVVTSEIKLAENKLVVMRKKVDEQIEKNKKIRREVDEVRKEINTLKQLSKTMQASFQKTSEQFQQYSQLSRTLDEEIANKNTLMHRTKIQNQHKKAEMIRQYNEILKCLQKQLEEDQAKQKQKSIKSDSQYLYFTQYDQKLAKPGDPKSDRKMKFSQVSIRKSKSNIPTQILAIKEKLERYEKEFDDLKSKTGARTSQEIIRKYQAKYEENFDFYKFINELHSTLQDKRRQNQELRQQRDEQVEQALLRASQAKQEQIANINKSLESVRAEKLKYSAMCQKYEQKLNEVKHIICQFYRKVDMGKSVKIEQLCEQNILKHLVEIRQVCRRLDSKFETEEEKVEYQPTETELAEMLENVKKQNNHDSTDPRNDRIMSREDFLKSRENVKKRPTPRKPQSKK